MDSYSECTSSDNAGTSSDSSYEDSSQYGEEENDHQSRATSIREQDVKSCKRQRSDDGDEVYYQNRVAKWALSRRALREQEQGCTLGESSMPRAPAAIASSANASDGSADGYDNSVPEEAKLPHPILDQVQIADGFRLPGEIHTSLFDYQREGVRWLWGLHQQKTGGILGDEMGLGKTVQIIAFLAGLFFSGLLDGPVIVLCPATMLDQWAKEFNFWWPPLRTIILHSSGSVLASDEDTDNAEGRLGDARAESTRIRTLAESAMRRVTKHGHIILVTYEGLRRCSQTLLRYRWSYAILDEGHKIRNPEAEITRLCKQLNTPHRIILSGTPIQNNLNELWSLFDFIYPGRLGTLPVFESQFAIPISMGGYANASHLHVEIAYKCANVLRDLMAPYLLQRAKKDVAKDLPTKSEHVLLCRLTSTQRQAYESFLQSKEMGSIMRGERRVLYGIDILKKICNHPDLLDVPYSSSMHLQSAGGSDKSGKMRVLKTLLEQWHHARHRVLLFSQTRIMLNFLESMVKAEQYSYRRMDGTTPVRARAALIHEFNHDSDVFVFLLTTKVGGLGINLVGADRVVLFDPDWNPSTDVQARERAWRIGQRKHVAVYRLISAGTIEEKMYHRQIFKHYLSRKILKDPKQKRFFKMHDLKDLFTLGADSSVSTETGELFDGAEVLPPVCHKDDPRSVRPEPTETTASGVGHLSSIVESQKISELMHSANEASNMVPNATPEEDALLKRLFAMNGIKSIIRHDNIADAANQESSLVEKEAAMFASQAVAALKRSGAPQVRKFGTMSRTDKPRTDSHSKSLLDNLRRPSATKQSHGTEPVLSGLMRELFEYLKAQGGRVQSGQLVAAFQSRIQQDEAIVFRKLLKEIATFERDRFSRSGWWILKPEYK